MRFCFVLFFALFLCFSRPAFSQTTYYPARGFYNGFLEQINIIECDNNNSQEVNLTLKITDNEGTELTSEDYKIGASGSRHIILNDLTSIANSYGVYTLSLEKSQALLGDRLNCRTSFYRPSHNGSKAFEYAYIIPVQNPQVGILSGIYNSMDPGNSNVITENWLSIVNLSTQEMSGVVEIYNTEGVRQDSTIIEELAVGARQDIPLGHPQGSHTGLYKIIPKDPSLAYEAFVVRYNQKDSDGFNFAFPLRALRGSCSGEPLLASTMGNGLTDNWLEIANTTALPINVTLNVRDRDGDTLLTEDRSISAFAQTNLYLSAIIDPEKQGNVGSVTITCEDKNDELVIQSTFYGKSSAQSAIEWAYSTQSRDSSTVTSESIMNVPVNTYAKMTNWLKLANTQGKETTAQFEVFNENGISIASGDSSIEAHATADIGIHEMTGPEAVGSIALNNTTAQTGFTGEMLRVLPKDNGEVGSIVSIPGIVQKRGIESGFQFNDNRPSFRGDSQSLAPYKDMLTHAEASHFLDKVALGGTQDELEALKTEGLKNLTNRLLTISDEPEVYEEAFKLLYTRANNPTHIHWDEIRRFWIYHMQYSKHSLREKMAIVLHDLFATSCSVVQGNHLRRYKCFEHMELLRRESLGNFKRLLHAMNSDYTMLRWLNNDVNVKEQPDEKLRSRALGAFFSR